MRSMQISPGRTRFHLAGNTLANPHPSTDGSPPSGLSSVRNQTLAMVAKSGPSIAFAPADSIAAGKLITMLAISREADRLAIGAHGSLFADGDPASCYYYVLSGEFIVHRRRDGMRPSVRFVGPGDLVMFAGAGLRDANCDAITAASVVALDGETLATLAAANAAVHHYLERLRASDRELVLSALTTMRDRHSEPDAQQPDITGPAFLHDH